MRESLIKELCIYLGELDYIVENSKDYDEKNSAEGRRESIHLLLGLPYMRKHNRINYNVLINNIK